MYEKNLQENVSIIFAHCTTTRSAKQIDANREHHIPCCAFYSNPIGSRVKAAESRGKIVILLIVKSAHSNN